MTGRWPAGDEEWRGASQGPRTPVGLLSSVGDGLRWPGHARRQLPTVRYGGGGAPMMVALGERAREMEHDEVKAVTEVEGCEALEDGAMTVAMELDHRRPWRARPRAAVAREEEESE